MSDELDLRGFLRTTFIAADGDDYRAGFIIDGRKYATSDAVRAAFAASSEALAERQIPAEYELRPIDPDEPAPPLPSWDEYQQTL